LPQARERTLEEQARVPGNQDCADCGALDPDWASVNQGVRICITCAGAHRSLGAHITKVKSLSLDTWKADEVASFIALGGNAEVNRRLLGRLSGTAVGQRPGPGASRAELDRHIAAKYGAPPPSSAASSSDASPVALAGGRCIGGGAVSSTLGAACHQGLVIAEVVSVELSDERARELRMLGPLFLNLAVRLSLGSTEAELTQKRRGTQAAKWDPPERRQMLWNTEDPSQHYLTLTVLDGGALGSEPTVAAEGFVDLIDLGEVESQSLSVDLWCRGEGEEEDLEEEEADRSEGAIRGEHCGTAEIRLTIIDMSGMGPAAQRHARR